MMRGTVTIAAFTWAVSLIFSPPASGTMKKCVGPDGDVKLTNQDCPAGYVLEASRAASAPPSLDEDEPRICRLTSILTSQEIGPAVTEAESALAQAKEKGDDGLAGYWQKCLDEIRQREAALYNRAQSPEEEGAPEPCVEGTFDYREGGMFFTSSLRGACTGVRATCTFEVRESQQITTTDRGVLGNRRNEGVSTTTGARVRNFDFQGKIGRWGTARIGDVNITGRVTGWNCLIEQ